MSRGPLPSEICLLSSLPDRQVGDKVRFLGCVTAYSTATATVRLGHLYPEGTDVVVSVDVQLLLQTLQPGITRVGEWVNVIGYLIERPKARRRRPDIAGAFVQALVMWPTGPLDLKRYEATFDEK